MYALLSGRSPFLTHKPKEDTALNIMKRIRNGDVRMETTSSATDAAAWKHVTPAAKQLVRGLLTVDPKKRLNLDDLFNSAWIKLAEQQPLRSTASASSVQLLSPAVLSDQPMGAKRSLMQTYNAFHRVTREGGLPTATAPTSAKLVITTSKQQQHHLHPQHQQQRSRCQQKPHAKTASTSSSSGCSSLSSSSNSLSSPTKQLLASPWSFYGSKSSCDSGIGGADSVGGGGGALNYRTSSRIHDYLNSLSQIQQAKLSVSGGCSSPSSSSSCSSASSSASSSHAFPSPSPAPTALPPPQTSPSEALSGVSYRLLPASSLSSHHSPPPPPLHPFLPASTSSVSITAVPPLVSPTSTFGGSSGIMTRSRKRKMRDDDDGDDDGDGRCGSKSGVSKKSSSNNNLHRLNPAAAAATCTLAGGVSVTAIQELNTTRRAAAAAVEVAPAAATSVDLFIRATPAGKSAAAAVSLIPIKEESTTPSPMVIGSPPAPSVTVQPAGVSTATVAPATQFLPPVTITID